jgi:hypothetical protein
MFFIKIRHDWPDKMLELFFGVSDGTAANYVDEMQKRCANRLCRDCFTCPNLRKWSRVSRKSSEMHIRLCFSSATRPTKQFLFRRTLRTIRLRSASTSEGQRCKWCFVRCLAVWCLVFMNPLVVLGITPDDRIVGRSLLYGGKAHEVADIVNKRTWA